MTTSETYASVTLPNGLWWGDACLREARVRPLDGADEAALLSSLDLSPARRVSELLARCVALAGGPPDALTTARSLSVGDREALLLHLRRASFGETIDVVLDCPSPTCGERMDLALTTGELLVTPSPSPRRDHEVAVGAARVRFRLVTGGDQESAAANAHDAPAATRLLLERCVAEVEVAGRREAIATLSPDVLDGVVAALAEADPQAELQFDVACPACGYEFPALFDTAAILLAEIDRRSLALLREVHVLASHYHWSEAEILRLPWRRRRQYLDLLAEAAERRGP